MVQETDGNLNHFGQASPVVALVGLLAGALVFTPRHIINIGFEVWQTDEPDGE